MKFSKETLEILTNFSSIFNQIVFYQGKEQRLSTKPKKMVLAQATIAEEIPLTFGIYDLRQFLGVMSLLNEPELDFQEKVVVISEGNKKITYRYCKPDIVETFTDTEAKKIDALKQFDVTLDLPKEVLTQGRKIISTLQNTFLAFEGDGSKAYLKSHNPKDPGDSHLSLEIGETDKRFTMVIDMDKLRLLDHDYKINISKHKIMKLFSKQSSVIYTIPCEAEGSHFDG